MTPSYNLTNVKKYDEFLQTKCDNIINNMNQPILKIDKHLNIGFNDHKLLIDYHFTTNQLRYCLKTHNLKISGTKKIMTSRLFSFLYLSSYANKIQKCFRNYLGNQYILCKGPAIKNRKICVNETDFLTMENVKEISNTQFFSFKDEDNFIYGFDVLSFYNLISKNDKLKNPYNRNELSLDTINKFSKLLRISRMFNMDINTEIEDINNEISTQKSIELRIFGLFQNINELGNYSDATWFTNLTRMQLIKFVKELNEIWNYRSQINEQTKRAICHPHGNPFRHFNLGMMYSESNAEVIRKEILIVLENMVKKGIDKDNKTLGSYYVLGALTLVSTQAASALPWLYQSMLYN